MVYIITHTDGRIDRQIDRYVLTIHTYSTSGTPGWCSRITIWISRRTDRRVCVCISYTYFVFVLYIVCLYMLYILYIFHQLMQSIYLSIYLSLLIWITRRTDRWACVYLYYTDFILIVYRVCVCICIDIVHITHSPGWYSRITTRMITDSVCVCVCLYPYPYP